MRTNATIKLWGTVIGAVSLDDSERIAEFEYDPSFLRSGIQLSPIAMPLKRGVYRFPDLAYETFHGLPGLVADSLPDRFGNSMIDMWLARQGRLPESFNAVERLCYTGSRGMGALEFSPSIATESINERIKVSELVELASKVLKNRQNLRTVIDEADMDGMSAAISQIISVGSSAGGARAKAVIAFNPETNEVRSGQLGAPDGFEHWLIKFSGVAGNRDKEEEDREDFGMVEYAYYLMALASGIRINECRLLDDGRNTHFMTRRFDRDKKGDKIHMQSLCAIAHMDFNQAGRYSYEQEFSVLNALNVHHSDFVEAYRRMMFNVLAFNCDDHTKNISFLMDRNGIWSLSPAYDVSFAFNPNGYWTSSHQMTVNGKRRGISGSDFEACARMGNLTGRETRESALIVREAISRWREFAGEAGLSKRRCEEIGNILDSGLSRL